MKIKKLFVLGILIASLLIFTGCAEMDTSGIFNDTPNTAPYDSSQIVSKIDKTLAQVVRTEVATGNKSPNKNIPSLEARIEAIDRKCKAMSQSEFEKLVKSSALDLAFQMNKISNSTGISDDAQLKAIEKIKKYSYAEARQDMKGLIKGLSNSSDVSDVGSVYGIVAIIERALGNGNQLTDTTLAEIPDDIIYTFLEKQDGDYFRSFINQQKLTEVSKTMPEYYNQMLSMVAMFGQLSGENVSISISPVTTVGGLNSYASYLVTEILMDKEFTEQIKSRKLPEYLKLMKEDSEENNIEFFDEIYSDTNSTEDNSDNSKGIADFKRKFRIK